MIQEGEFPNQKDKGEHGVKRLAVSLVVCLVLLSAAPVMAASAILEKFLNGETYRVERMMETQHVGKVHTVKLRWNSQGTFTQDYEVLTFDQWGRLIGDVWYLQDGSVYQSEQVERQNGNIVKYTLADDRGNTLVIKYNYLRNKLISESSSWNNKPFKDDVKYTYDTNGRLITRFSERRLDYYPDGSGFISLPLWAYDLIAYNYDDVGRLISEVRWAGDPYYVTYGSYVKYSYDKFGRMTKKAYSDMIGEDASLTVNYVYSSEPPGDRLQIVKVIPTFDKDHYTHVYFLNKEGLISSIRKDHPLLDDSLVSSYKYVYDKDNWVRYDIKSDDQLDGYFAIREITYY